MRFVVVLIIIGNIIMLSGQNVPPYKTLVAHKNKVTRLNLSADGNYLVSSGVDHTVKIWDINSFTEIKTLKGHKDKVWNLVISSDNKYVLSGSLDASFILWDFNSGKILEKVKITPHEVKQYSLYEGTDVIWPNSVYGAAFNEANSQIAVGTSGGAILIYNLHPFQFVQSLEKHTGKVYEIIYAKHDSILISGAGSKEIIVWNAKTFQPLHVFSEKNGYNGSFQLFNNNRFLANTGHCDINIWDMKTAEKVRVFTVHCKLKSVRLTNDEKYMITCGEDHTVRIYNYETGKQVWAYKNPTPEIADCKISPDGTLLAVATPEGKILIWKIEDLINL